MKTVAFATYSGAPELIAEDRPLVPLLSKLGIQAVPQDWECAVPAGLDAVILRSCWNSHLKPDVFLRWIEGLQVPLWNPAPVVRWNQDKAHLLELQANGIPVPRTSVLPAGSISDRFQWIAASGLEVVVIKPTISASSYGTFRLRAADQDSVSAALSTIPESSPLLLQQLIPEILSEGELSFIFFSGKFSHAVLKRAKAGDFRVQEDFGGSREHFTPAAGQIDEATEILRVAGGLDWLYARVDGVMVGGCLCLMELEAMDPMFYFAWAPQALDRFARAIADRV